MIFKDDIERLCWLQIVGSGRSVGTADECIAASRQRLPPLATREVAMELTDEEKILARRDMTQCAKNYKARTGYNFRESFAVVNAYITATAPIFNCGGG